MFFLCHHQYAHINLILASQVLIHPCEPAEVPPSAPSRAFTITTTTATIRPATPGCRVWSTRVRIPTRRPRPQAPCRQPSRRTASRRSWGRVGAPPLSTRRKAGPPALRSKDLECRAASRTPRCGRRRSTSTSVNPCSRPLPRCSSSR